MIILVFYIVLLIIFIMVFCVIRRYKVIFWVRRRVILVDMRIVIEVKRIDKVLLVFIMEIFFIWMFIIIIKFVEFLI